LHEETARPVKGKMQEIVVFDINSAFSETGVGAGCASCSHFFRNLIAQNRLIRAPMAKIPHSLWRAGLCASVLIAFVGSTKAQSPTPSGTTAEQYQSSGSLPSPSLLFDELDKAFPNFDWKTVVEKEVNDPNFQKTDYSDNVAKISNLGVRLAAAFIAVHAKDYDALKKAAGVAVELTKSFKEAGTIKSYADQAEQQAKGGDWAAVKTTIDKIADVVGKELKNGSRREEATMAMATGWLAGVHLVADALGSQYSEKGALIIRQGPLPTLIVAQLKALSDTVKEKNGGKQEDKTKSSTVQDVTVGVTQIADLVKKEPTKPLTKEEVENIRKQAADLIKKIEA
jgi:bacterioferritin-associated ferredoxin